MVSRIVCLAMLVGIASTATFRGNLPVKPHHLAHKEGCYVQEVGDVIPFGTAVSPVGYCYRIECERHMIYYASCGVVNESYDSPNCYITDIDLSRSYPSCCPDIKCDVDNNLI